ncbi:DUF3109 family protein [Chlorobaculum sp. 24CR]|uniref:DUF3109 family protein n=1 Tax=Chlorobaculum sp. 24CR TaxID=2508878 RepID=UPI001431E159|nr:DUF3109 family protein [Chlorobaculum sp. 24CR]
MSVLSIGEVLVDRAVLEARFCCNLDLCHGACCVEGELGAPIDEPEANYLEASVEPLRPMLPERNLRYIRRHDCTEIYQGNLYTKTIEGQECVFVYHENGKALCAVETAWRNGQLPGTKPLSCRLFPIRVRKKFGLDYLVYEQHAMCRDARRQGAERNVMLIDYVKAPLVEKYGDEWYMSLKEFAASI